jgi:hypothetical protein
MDSKRADAPPEGKETNDELKERVRREQHVAARLRLATERLEGAQQERIWAIVEAHQSGLFVRQIVSATGLGPSRALIARWKETLFPELSADFDGVGLIDAEDFVRDSADRSQPFQSRPLPGKVVLPAIAAGLFADTLRPLPHSPIKVC